MKIKTPAEPCSAIYHLHDGSVLEVSHVELSDEDYTYRRCEVAYRNAIDCYLALTTKNPRMPNAD